MSRLSANRSLVALVVLLFTAGCGGSTGGGTGGDTTPPTDIVEDSVDVSVDTDAAPDVMDIGVPDVTPDIPDTTVVAEKKWNAVSLETVEHIRDVWGPGDGTFYAVGDHGTMIWFNGSSWIPLPRMTDADLLGVSGIAGGDVYIVGKGGTVLRRDQAGWNVVNTFQDPAVDLYDVALVSNSDVYIVGDAGVILRFDGSAFSADLSNTTSNLRTVFAVDGGGVVAGGTQGQIYRRTGGQWVSSQVTGGSVTINDVWAASNSFQVAVGTAGTILVSTGTNWSPQTSNDIKARDLHAVWGTSENDVYCVGSSGVLIHYNGNKWTEVIVDGPLFSTRSLHAVWGTTMGSRTLGFTAGEKGTLMRLDIGNEEVTDDVNWGDTVNGPDRPITDVAYAGDDTYVAVGHSGIVMRWRPFKGWHGVPSGTTTDLNSVATAGDGNAWAAGDAGTVIQITGDQVTPVENGISSDLNGAASLGTSALFVGTAGLAVQVSPDAFVEEETSTLMTLNDVWLNTDGSGFAVGNAGTITARTTEGQWSTQPSGTTYILHAVTGQGDHAWAAGDHGILLHWNGETWTKEQASINLSGKYLYGLWADENADVLAVGWLGTVLRRVDGSWIPEDSQTSNVLESITGGDDGAVWVVGRKGTVLRRKP